MRAVVKTAKGPGLTELKDWPRPEAGAGHVVVRVENAAVCASDVHIVHDRFMYQAPLVLGHEFCGTIASVGEGVGDFRAGERVVSENNPYACGRCRICRSGFPNLCPDKKAIGFKSDGCFADYVRLPAGLLHRVPPNVSSEAASLSEPLAVAVHAVADRGRVTPGDTVVVIGPGAIGLLAAQVAKAEGASRVLMVGTNSDEGERFDCARKFGFEVCNVEKARAEDSLGADLDRGEGADMVVEAAGAAKAVDLATRLVRRAGQVVVLGITGQATIPLAWDRLVAKGASVLFSYSSRRDNWDRAMQLMGDGTVDIAPLISCRIPLEDWAAGIERMERREAIRVVFDIAKGVS